jgi:hypothetical protein
MPMKFTDEQWRELAAQGILRVPGAVRDRLGDLNDAIAAITARYPYGFADPHYYSGRQPAPLTAGNKRPNGHILVPYAGFLDTRIVAPLADPALHAFLERIVGKDFYFSNTWYQEVGPNTPRLGFHKDPRGSITFNILLDDIETGMGGTCLVPGSHINTPPASYCMGDTDARHPLEVDVTGKAGDIVFFTPETWHGRSRNEGGHTTRRLFYNFYSRSSRDTTTWNGIASREQLDAAMAVVPPEFHHMFQIDRDRTRSLTQVNGSALRKWVYRRSTSDSLVRDFFYAAFAYGHTAENKSHPGYLMPFTIRLAEARRFSALRYLSHMKIIPSLKNLYRFLRSLLSRSPARREAMAE